jgi:hypothetical protein
MKNRETAITYIVAIMSAVCFMGVVTVTIVIVVIVKYHVIIYTLVHKKSSFLVTGNRFCHENAGRMHMATVNVSNIKCQMTW